YLVLLLSIEDEAERIYEDERGLLLDNEAASTRDTMYDQAEFAEREMEHMIEQIKSQHPDIDIEHLRYGFSHALKGFTNSFGGMKFE
ncbi:hypothetical protein KSS87_011270, partial [Heliosperma pusillum]